MKALQIQYPACHPPCPRAQADAVVCGSLLYTQLCL